MLLPLQGLPHAGINVAKTGHFFTDKLSPQPQTDSVLLTPRGGKVGLVLAGGGAKGLYHIGVIQALEENSIPIDYISGTSMGAIIGALYASGYTVEQMREIVTSGKVEKWVSGQLGSKYKFYYNERPDSPSMLSVYAETKRDSLQKRSSLSVSLPNSFIDSSQIDMALIELFAAASAASGGNFDKLMIPFRCMATDMNAHQPVEYRSGDLPFAVRASMAYPLVFQPVTDSEGRVLVDGGCYNNFPWQVLVKDFDPALLIGSQCIDGDLPVKKNASVEKQVMALVTMPTDYSLPEDKGFIIKRDVDASVFDFAGGEATIEQGYADALAAVPKLLNTIESRRSPAEVEAMRSEFLSRCPELKFSDFQVEGLRKRQTEYARTFMHFEKPDGDTVIFEPLSFKDVQERYFTLMATGDFTSQGFPRIEYDSLSEDFGIKFDLESKPGVKFHIAGNISSTSMNQISFGMNYLTIGRTAQSAFADIFLGPLSSLVRMGGRTVFLGRTPMYLDYSMQGTRRTSLRGSFGAVAPVRNAIKARVIEAYLHGAFGIAVTRKSIFEVAANAGYNFYAYESSYDDKGDPDTHDRFRYVAGRVAFERSTLDKAAYATHGSKLSLSGIVVHGRDRFENEELFAENIYAHRTRSWVGAKLQWQHYPGDWQRTWFSVGYDIEAVYTSHPHFGNRYAEILSAPRYAPTPNSNMIYMPEFFAHRYAAVGVMPTFRMAHSLYLRAGVYAMLRDPVYLIDDYMHYMADLSLVYHTRIGPVSLSLSKYDFTSKNNMYVTFNFGYPIFGGKGLFY